MKSPRHRRRRHKVGFQMLSKQAQEQLVKYEYAVIWLMVLIAITSIIWSISLHILSGDFNNGIIGAKLIFQERDFHHMDNRAKEVFYHELGDLINRTYTDAALEERLIKTTVENTVRNSHNHNDDSNYSQNRAELNTTENTIFQDTTTAKPKKKRILHLFQTYSSLNRKNNLATGNRQDNDDDDADDDDDDEEDETNTTILLKRRLDVIADRKFLASMIADVEQSIWRQSASLQFVYSFPFLTEIMAIIWTAMCLVFQSGVKKYWGLPKPWRIVVPSIFVFTLMTLGTIIYIVITNRFLKIFCTGLRAPLTDPNLISCGEAMSVLRPIIKRHQFNHDVYLSLFRASFVLSFLLWALALVIMVLRYVFAIDFQLVDIHSGYQSPLQGNHSSELTVIKTKTFEPKQSASNMLRVDERTRHKSEDDFQSAKSNLSEVATPLLEKSSDTQPKIV